MTTADRLQDLLSRRVLLLDGAIFTADRLDDLAAHSLLASSRLS